MKYNYNPSTSQYRDWPMRLYLADLHVEGLDKPLRVNNNLNCDWGELSPVVDIDGDALPMPHLLVQRWWSPEELEFYNAVVPIDTERAEKLWNAQENNPRLKWQSSRMPSCKYSHIVIGMAPYGGTAIWLAGDMKSTLLQYVHAEAVEVTPEIFTKLCNDNAYARRGIELPPQSLFEGWMRQYNYRYVPLEEYWDGNSWQVFDNNDLYYDDIDVISLQDKRTDGTYNLSEDLEQLDHMTTALPRHFCVHWQVGGKDYEAHYWVDDQALARLFNRFFNLHPESKADLLVRIDIRAHRYELALADSEELLKPETIPAEVYQMLLFENNKEFYKTENYAQEKGAWRW